MKRVFDLFLSVFGIFISSPLWFLLIFLIWLEDRQGVFYLQERVGMNGRIFKTIQFRSMFVGIEKKVGPLQAKENDWRVTRIGRYLRITALDALPQLWNIAKGEMSFVGPRALRQVEIDSASNVAHSIWEFPGARERSVVRPGLTGIAQILLSRDAPREVKFKYDVWYTKNRSFILDLQILLASFLILLSGKWESRFDKLGFFIKRIEKAVKF